MHRDILTACAINLRQLILCQVTIQEYSLDYFGKTDQFVGFSEKYSSFSCHTFAAVKLV